MIETTLAEVTAATRGTRPAEAAGPVVATGVSTDSRTCGEGVLFAAVRGERADGHDFVESVLDAGAAGALVARDWLATSDLPERRPELAGRLVGVDDVVAALGDLARDSLSRLRAQQDLRVVALTGSVGKTTTKDLLAGVLRGDLDPSDPAVISPPGSFNNEIGLPLTVLRATRATRVLVLEMGADHVGNIAHLTSVAPPDVALVLAVGRAHLGEFGGIDAVARAKSEMVTGAVPEGVVVLNGDDARVRAMDALAGTGADGAALPAAREVRTFSASGDAAADVSAARVTTDARDHARFTLVVDGVEAGEVELGLVGVHHVANALAAASAALALGVEPTTVVQRLTGLRAASPHRMAVSERPDGVLVVDDAYNANPDSMRAGLTSLAAFGRERDRTVAVLGRMLELGEDSPAEHAGVGAELDRLGIDVLVEVGDGGYAQGTAGTAVETHVVADTGQAGRLLADLARPGDVILFKGSNGSGLWRLADEFTAADREEDVR